MSIQYFVESFQLQQAYNASAALPVRKRQAGLRHEQPRERCEMDGPGGEPDVRAGALPYHGAGGSW